MDPTFIPQIMVESQNIFKQALKLQEILRNWGRWVGGGGGGVQTLHAEYGYFTIFQKSGTHHPHLLKESDHKTLSYYLLSKQH